jgi:hypothetical protein
MIPTFPCTLPIDCPSDDEAIKDFDGLLQYTPRVRKLAWDSRSIGITKMHDYTLPIDRVGMQSSNRYHYNARMACDSVNSPSVVRSWYIQKFRKGLEASIYYEKSPKTALALRKYIPSQFRAACAKTLYKAFEAKKVYDPCMGWGDRLSGAMASDLELYYGRDVNPFLFGGYSEQVKAYSYSSNIQVAYEMIGSETSCPEENFFDLVFTSPPYFKAEKYAGENQSHALYKKFDQWLDGFMFPMAKNSLDSINEEGHVAFNVSDIYCDHKTNHICEPLINYMISLGANYKGAIGYEMGKRLNKNSSKSQTAGFSEPVLIFGKKNSKTLDDIFGGLDI